MAYPTKEFHKIEFQFWLYTKVGFGSCRAGINILLTAIHGYLEAPFSRVLNTIVYGHIPNLDALYLHSYYFATPLCFSSCNAPQSVSIVICIPSFDLMFKQLNEASRKVVHFTGRPQFPSKNLQNSTKVEILLVCGINYGNYTNI